MSTGLARLGDAIEGGAHCHGHEHGPQPSPGAFVMGSAKVFVDGKPVVRLGDPGFSPSCCGKQGIILPQAGQGKVFVEQRPVIVRGDRTLHCAIGIGKVQDASDRVVVND